MSESLSDLHLPVIPILTADPRSLLLPDTGEHEASRPQGYAAHKPWVEVVVAALLLVLSAPVVLVAAVLVKLTSRGPAFYTQVRVGRDGRPYTIYKLRTMVEDSEAGTGAVWSQAGDPRVTPIGRFLRATHLDELPQLVNVLMGDMGLSGPRPERPEIVERLKAK